MSAGQNNLRKGKVRIFASLPARNSSGLAKDDARGLEGKNMSKKLLIQGAIESEICWYLEQECFQKAEKTTRNGFLFYRTEQEGREILLQLTKMGTIYAAIATMTAIYEFQPDIIINQGTAGAQVDTLKSGDLVIGSQAVNVHSLEMPKRDFGEGMAPEEWLKMETEYVAAAPELVQKFEQEIGQETRTGKVVSGILGTGDLFSKEKDRIQWLHDTFGHLSEDMESFAVYKTCQECGVPCVALRVISNNELLNEDYDKRTSLELQRVVWETINHCTF